ncbi:MAG TPA: RNA polymerase sigma factor [Terriglobales bacterium]|nr:RNA polymerase sigma factor [Terriglobales bacterium]
MLAPNANSERGTLAVGANPPAFPPQPEKAEGLADLDHISLVREAQQGNSAAFEELVRSYDQPVLRLALRITASESDAQDIYQDTFLRAYQSLGGFRFECSFYTWIHRITTNVCLDYLRKRQKQQRQVTVMVSQDGEETEMVQHLPDLHPTSDPERCLRQQELRRKIARALRELSPRERMVFELKHYHNLKLRTVADMLKTSEGTVKNTLFRATHKLRLSLAVMR